MEKYFRNAGIVILALIIILSCTFVGDKLTDPATYSHTIEVLDHNRTTVLGLTAASAAASAAVSTLPEDICSPLAEEISDFTTYFMAILSVIYLEKYLLTILAAAACYLLIPAGCSALLINCFFAKAVFQKLGSKLLVFGLALILVIPTSVWVSDKINETYSHSIDMAVQSANAVSENLTSEVSDESATVIDEAKALLGDLSGSVARVVKQFKNLLNRFIEATAVMVVTTCLIPILVIVFFVWLVSALFNVKVTLPTNVLKRKKRKYSLSDEGELSLDEDELSLIE